MRHYQLVGYNYHSFIWIITSLLVIISSSFPFKSISARYSVPLSVSIAHVKSFVFGLEHLGVTQGEVVKWGGQACSAGPTSTQHVSNIDIVTPLRYMDGSYFN